MNESFGNSTKNASETATTESIASEPTKNESTTFASTTTESESTTKFTTESPKNCSLPSHDIICVPYKQVIIVSGFVISTILILICIVFVQYLKSGPKTISSTTYSNPEYVEINDLHPDLTEESGNIGYSLRSTEKLLEIYYSFR